MFSRMITLLVLFLALAVGVSADTPASRSDSSAPRNSTLAAHRVESDATEISVVAHNSTSEVRIGETGAPAKEVGHPYHKWHIMKESWTMHGSVTPTKKNHPKKHLLSSGKNLNLSSTPMMLEFLNNSSSIYSYNTTFETNYTLANESSILEVYAEEVDYMEQEIELVKDEVRVQKAVLSGLLGIMFAGLSVLGIYKLCRMIYIRAKARGQMEFQLQENEEEKRSEDTKVVENKF